MKYNSDIQVFLWIPIPFYEHYTLSVCDWAHKAYKADTASPVKVEESDGFYLNQLIKQDDVLSS
jgi:hypothetical protein